MLGASGRPDGSLLCGDLPKGARRGGAGYSRIRLPSPIMGGVDSRTNGEPMSGIDSEECREYLHWVRSLRRSMEQSVRSDDPSDVWKYSTYRQYARKYNQLAEAIGKQVRLPPVLDYFNVEQMKGPTSTIAMQQKDVFQAVHANLSVLEAFLESRLGFVEDEIDSLRDFLHSRIRAALFEAPTSEKQVQDALERLLIGRGLQKGDDYDREVGRVKVSSKEVIPDFIFPRLDLGLEVKLLKEVSRISRLVDEINADIVSYKRGYRHVLFLVYDLGHIRDEAEFRRDLEHHENVTVLVIKH